MRAWLLFAMLSGCQFTGGAAPSSSDGGSGADGALDHHDAARDGASDVGIDGFSGATIRINLGGAQYTGSSDNPGVWAADAEPGICNGAVYPAPTGTTAINGTMDLALFDKYVYAASLICTIPSVPAGTYDVRLMIAEVYRGNLPCTGGPGTRKLVIVMEGVTVASAFDEMAAGGGCAAVAGATDGGGHAFTQVYSGIAVTDGALDLSVTPTGDSTAPNGVLSAIELVQTGA